MTTVVGGVMHRRGGRESGSVDHHQTEHRGSGDLHDGGNGATAGGVVDKNLRLLHDDSLAWLKRQQSFLLA